MKNSLFILFTLLISLNKSFSAENNNIENGTYFKPVPPANKYYKPTPVPPQAANQYKRDTGKYNRETLKTSNYYVNFDINFSIFNEIDDLIVDRIEYPGTDNTTNDSIETPNYTNGVMDGSGGLGLDIAFGYEKNGIFGIEVEMSMHRILLDSITNSNFASVSKDAGNYTETGPEIISNQNDELKVIPISANIIFNLSRNKKITPYIGGGAGMAMVGITKEYEFHPVYTAKAGINYKLSDKINISIGYKKLFLDEIDYKFSVTETNTDNTLYDKREYNFRHDLELDIISFGYKFKF